MQQHPYVVLGSPNIEFIVANNTVSDPTRAILERLGPGKHDVDKLRMVGPHEFSMRVVVEKKHQRFHLHTKSAHVAASGSAMNIARGLQRARLLSVLCGAFADPDTHQYSHMMLNVLREEEVRVERMERVSVPYSFIIPPNGISDESIVLIFKPGYPISKAMRSAVVKQRSAAEPRCVIASSVRTDELDLVKSLFIGCRHALRVFIPSKSVLRRSGRRRLLETLKHVDLLQMNEEEAALFQYEELPRRHLSQDSLMHIATRSGVRNVIITQADLGASVLIDGQYATCHATKPKEIKDQSGGGDAFLVGYLWARDRGWVLLDRLHVASYCASRVIAELGSGAGMPKLSELESRFRSTIQKQQDDHAVR